MNYFLIVSLVIILLAVTIVFVIRVLIIWNFYGLRKEIKKEFPDQPSSLKLMIGKLIPEGTPFKDRVFKSSKIAEQRMREIFSEEISTHLEKANYESKIRSIARLHALHNIVVGVTILLIVLALIFFKIRA